jgi:integrase
LATLSHLFNRAVDWKWLDRLPARPRKFAETGGRIIALDDEQCSGLMRAAIASADPDLHLFVAVALNTGMRHGEIIAIRWEDLDLDRRRLFVPKAKAGQRVQPITAELADLLRRERDMRDDREGWVFPSPHSDSKTGHRTHIKRPFQDAARAAGLDPDLVTPHVLRHTAITNLVQAGVDLPTIQRISGHKTMAMVLRYTHVHGDHIDAAIAALGRTLPQQGENNMSRQTSPKLHHADFRAGKVKRLPR